MVAVLHQASIRGTVLNHARVWHFARARGQQAKTDCFDAAVPTACGQALQTPTQSGTLGPLGAADRAGPSPRPN